MMISPKPVWD